MSGKTIKFTNGKTVAKPVRVKFRLKAGGTLSIKAVRTFQQKRSARTRAKG